MINAVCKHTLLHSNLSAIFGLLKEQLYELVQSIMKLHTNARHDPGFRSSHTATFLILHPLCRNKEYCLVEKSFCVAGFCLYIILCIYIYTHTNTHIYIYILYIYIQTHICNHYISYMIWNIYLYIYVIYHYISYFYI